MLSPQPDALTCAMTALMPPSAWFGAGRERLEQQHGPGDGPQHLALRHLRSRPGHAVSGC